MAIVSSGKSLQLIQHAPMMFSPSSGRGDNHEIGDCGNLNNNNPSKICDGQSLSGLTLSEVFCLSLAGLIGHGDHLSKYIWQKEPSNSKMAPLFQSFVDKKRNLKEISPESACKVAANFLDMKEKHIDLDAGNDAHLLKSFCPENPVITVCQSYLHENKDAWKALNVSKNFCLPPLNDEGLRNAIFGGKGEALLAAKGTNYTSGFIFGESQHLCSQDDTKMLEELFPFPTLLPSFQEELYMSEFLPFQKNSSLPSRVLSWILSVEPKATPLPVVVLQECLVMYIKKQVDYVGKNILSMLLYEWRLMDELGVLRDIYLLGSGDLLQHFLTVIFDNLDKGVSWDDDFELNMILQESIANSADGILLSAPDSLVVSITKNHGFSGDEQHSAATLVTTPRKSRGKSFGIDGLDSLIFTYKVSWPLELIAITEAIKKYNQVMGFLLKVKRAKYVLDKTRRWMWKGRGTVTINRKHHCAWRELCEGMVTSSSLDEVIEVHEAYLLSIQRQCFVVPDKLWALIASRINSILGLALDFYSIQQTLTSGGAVSAIKARCEMEVDRIEKQFDDCISFLLRVLSFKLNVGHFPYLADLVTRINYNYFYMSDNGNLVTALALKLSLLRWARPSLLEQTD
ncbi:Spc97 / Spc98 family of spindle pole body (SBP) component [Actinidia rufa]|uniref:Gamma-tubulin complex component n=1 Tax=Actinidia rufa TaxID=165716 RepID=A0A7J0FFU3_9ERIC|nr:Spc97 / Spc98 family of spindle pole body (SBP) component [Actinidia rufa]